jgi:restriction system protein
MSENLTEGEPLLCRRKFLIGLEGNVQKANKGIFITTSNFSDEAREYVKTIPTKVVLIDGEELAELMIDHDVGVSRETSYEVKKIDSDYFSEE